jgi:hypothetical protein
MASEGTRPKEVAILAQHLSRPCQESNSYFAASQSQKEMAF